jgi:activator of HSP90 ATPase
MSDTKKVIVSIQSTEFALDPDDFKEYKGFKMRLDGKLLREDTVDQLIERLVIEFRAVLDIAGEELIRGVARVSP